MNKNIGLEFMCQGKTTIKIIYVAQKASKREKYSVWYDEYFVEKESELPKLRKSIKEFIKCNKLSKTWKTRIIKRVEIVSEEVIKEVKE